MAAVLCVIACFAFLKTKRPPDPVTLNVSLYRVLPDYESFEETVRACWKEKHPEVELHFVDWDCYSAEVPEDLDVFVIDTTNLDTFAEKGYLLPLSENDIQDYDDLLPCFTEGCRVDGKLYVVPQILCTDLLYTRKGDTELQDVQTMDELYSVLGTSGLLTDKRSDSIKVCMYLQALIDEAQNYMDSYPPIEEGKLSQRAVDSLAEMRDMRQTEPEGVPENSGWYYYAQRFAQGFGRANIGYSEAMDVMGGNESEMDFRLFSMTDGDDVPVFYLDAAAVNAGISDQKKALALEFLNLITGNDMLVRASDHDGDPRYLLTARTSVYDALSSKYPIYAELKKVASVPEAYVFRIRPDGVTYMAEAERNADALPSFFK